MTMEKKSGKTYWFELPVSDIQRAKSFYTSLLGWKFQKLTRAEILNYWMIEVDGEFIGGLRKGKNEKKEGEAPMIYFCVENLGTKVKLAQTLGARLEGERIDLGLKRGCFQWLRDSEQNLIGLWADE